MKPFLALLAAWVIATSVLPAQTSLATQAKPPTIVLVSGEFEYQSKVTLPAFKQFLETNYTFNCIYLERGKGNDIPGLEALDRADLVIFFIRRMTLPEEQLAKIKNHVESGRPLIALRTSSHAFENWKEFDRQVLGGNYHNHFPDKLTTTARINPSVSGHPILRDVAGEFVAGGSLYKTSPVSVNATVLLAGSVTNQPAEPITWTHRCGDARIFYTSLGHPKDFENPSFRRLLVNAIFWALNDRAQNPTDRTHH
jgi:type 1 glutamine amidotransferase